MDPYTEILRGAHDPEHFVAFPGERHAAAKWGLALYILVLTGRVRRKPWPTSKRLSWRQLLKGKGAGYHIGVFPA